MTKPRINIHITPEADNLLRHAVADGLATKAAVVDTALKQLLDPSSQEREIKVLSDRLNRLTRVLERLSDETTAQTETLALYVLYYLCITPPLPESARAGAEALGQQRFDHFIGQVGDRLLGKEKYTDAVLAKIDLVRMSDENDDQASVESAPVVEAAE